MDITPVPVEMVLGLPKIDPEKPRRPYVATDFMDRAACRGMEEDPAGSMREQKQIIDTACSVCPVLTECLRWAVADRPTSLEHGIPVAGGWYGAAVKDIIREYWGAYRPCPCAFCGKEFVTDYPRKELCSDACRSRSVARASRNNSMRTRRTCTCRKCGKEFVASFGKVTCSDECLQYLRRNSKSFDGRKVSA